MPMSPDTTNFSPRSAAQSASVRTALVRLLHCCRVFHFSSPAFRWPSCATCSSKPHLEPAIVRSRSDRDGANRGRSLALTVPSLFQRVKAKAHCQIRNVFFLFNSPGTTISVRLVKIPPLRPLKFDIVTANKSTPSRLMICVQTELKSFGIDSKPLFGRFHP